MPTSLLREGSEPGDVHWAGTIEVGVYRAGWHVRVQLAMARQSAATRGTPSPACAGRDFRRECVHAVPRGPPARWL